MKAVVMNCFNGTDNVLVIDGGSFGHRFVELCERHEVTLTVIKLNHGQKQLDYISKSIVVQITSIIEEFYLRKVTEKQ